MAEVADEFSTFMVSTLYMSGDNQKVESARYLLDQRRTKTFEQVSTMSAFVVVNRLDLLRQRLFDGQ